MNSRQFLQISLLSPLLVANVLALGMNEAHKELTVDAYGQIPLYFEANVGQVNSQIRFLSRGKGYTLSLSPSEAVLTLRKPVEPEAGNEQPVARTRLRDLKNSLAFQTATVHLQLLGANQLPQVTGLEELSAKVNYFVGNDPKNWHTGIPTFAKVRYADVYPGVDLIYYGNQGKLEYDFVVAPGANPKVIRLRFEGLNSPLQISSEGHLVLGSAGGDLRLQKPFVYQKIDGLRHKITGRYSLRNDDSVGFELGPYDPSKTLIIDPVLEYSTYFSEGNSYAIAVDEAGNAYVSGIAAALPPSPPAPPPVDVFVAKLDPTGSELLYLTLFGGTVCVPEAQCLRGAIEIAYAIAVDDSGNAYVTGFTDTSDFPTVNALQPAFGGGPTDAFVVKLDSTGSELIYSTYLGGNGGDSGRGIALDDAGNVYLSGGTSSTDFPIVNAFQPVLSGGGDGFVTKMNSTGSALIYSTYLGGSESDGGRGIAVDAVGNAYVAGLTFSTDFPVANALQPFGGGDADGFVTKLNSTGSGLIYSTYLGGSELDQGRGIAVDAVGNAYVAGITFSTDFPTANALQPVFGGGLTFSGGIPSDVFIAKLNSSGSALIYSTYLGGSDRDQADGIAVDGFGRAYVTGVIRLPLPESCPICVQVDVFVAKLDSTGSALVFFTNLGGSQTEEGRGIAVDDAGNAYVIGRTTSPDFPTTPNALHPLRGSNLLSDAFVAKIIDIRTKIGVFRNGEWFLDFNGNGQLDDCTTDQCIPFGLSADLPATGDWNGSGTTKIGVFRKGHWSLDFNGNGQWDGCGIDQCIPFGLSADLPVTGDWNGSGTTKIGVFRKGHWSLDFNGNGQWDGCGIDQCIPFGLSADLPATGDWNGSGTTKIGVFRDGEWFLDFDGNGQWDGCGIDLCLIFGSPGYTPVTGDWDESRTTTTGVFQDDVWQLDSSGSGQFDDCTTVECLIFGLPGDLPVTGHW